MNRPSFERYLHTNRDLDGKAASDAASQCARVERGFNLNLDVELPRGELSNLVEWLKSAEGRKRMEYAGPDPHWYEPAVRALEKYAQYLKDGHRHQA